VLDYAEALTRSPTQVSEELREALVREFGEDVLVELTASIAWENFRARFNRGFDVPAQGFSEGACCPLPEAPPSDERPGGPDASAPRTTQPRGDSHA